jgi:phosphate butyryltransferase
MIRNMQELLEEARTGEPGRLAVAVAQDSYVLDAVVQAAEMGIVAPVLVGDREQIEQILVDLKADPRAYRIVDEADKTEACMVAARLVRDGEADFLMKGIVDTAVIMRAILNRDNGLRTGRMISDVLALEIEGYDHLFLVTDPAMSIAPTLPQKADLVRNAVDIAHALGNDNPKVAVLAAVEKVNEKMPCTVDAAELQAMNERGELEGCVVQGPLQFDNAVSVEAAKHKGISGEVAGKADIMLVPDIEAGNMLVKAAEFFGHAKKAGVIVGAKAPVALTSRASSAESKLYTIAIARLVARGQQA